MIFGQLESVARLYAQFYPGTRKLLSLEQSVKFVSTYTYLGASAPPPNGEKIIIFCSTVIYDFANFEKVIKLFSFRPRNLSFPLL